MSSELHEASLAASPAPLLAAIDREIEERRAAMKELEWSWCEALQARDIERVRRIVDRAAEHRKQLSLAREERARTLRLRDATLPVPPV